MNSRFSNFYGKLKEFKANAYKTPYAKGGAGGAGGPGGGSIGKIRKIFGGRK
jgi:hypothetical protein